MTIYERQTTAQLIHELGPMKTKLEAAIQEVNAWKLTNPRSNTGLESHATFYRKCIKEIQAEIEKRAAQ